MLDVNTSADVNIEIERNDIWISFHCCLFGKNYDNPTATCDTGGESCLFDDACRNVVEEILATKSATLYGRTNRILSSTLLLHRSCHVDRYPASTLFAKDRPKNSKKVIVIIIKNRKGGLVCPRDKSVCSLLQSASAGMMY